MYELINKHIKNTAPEKVYVFPELLTHAEIDKNVRTLHVIANKDADRTLYCLFDDIENKNRKYQVCFPLSHLDFKKYDINDIKVLQREEAVSAIYKGEFDELSAATAELTAYAKENGYEVHTPFRYLFILHKKRTFSKKAQEFSMEIHLPVKSI